MSIPKTQKAMIFDQNRGPIEYRDIPVQEPKADEILVNIKYSGVCHTDLHAWKGDWPLATSLPLVGGHEGAGVVVKIGSNVKNFKVGDHAGVKWINSTCQDCSFCEEGDQQLCAGADMSGYTKNGSFQQYCVVQATNAQKIPKDVPLDTVSPILCGGITVYRALKEAQLNSGQYIAVVGAGGGLGALALQYAKALGLRPLAIDAGAEKEKLCAELGAEKFIDFTKSKDIVADVKAATEDGLGPHGALLVAVVDKPLQQACSYVRSKGRVIVVGLPPDAQITAPVFGSVIKMLQIRCSYVGNTQDGNEAIDFFRRGLIKSPIKVVGLSELNHAYDEMSKGKIAGRFVLDCSR